MTPANVALNQRRLAAAYGKSELVKSFAAMVDELRPKWAENDRRRNAALEAYIAEARKGRPEPKPFTVDDYRALVWAYDAGAHMSDHREEWLSASYKHDELRRLAKTFDPDLSIWHEIDAQRRFK